VAEACPKCGYAEVQADECPCCRVIVSRYRAYLASIGQTATAAPKIPSVRAGRPVGTIGPTPPVFGGRPAGFWIRSAAAMVDAGFFAVVGFVIGVIGTILWGRDVMESRLMRASLTAFNLLFGSAYYIVCHWTWGQTIGKMVLNLRVVTTDGLPISLGTSVLRYIGYWLSTLILLVGYLMVGLRSDKRARHDLVARTRVIRP
jgi:uncharacterized RDD family membrane protein YckC